MSLEFEIQEREGTFYSLEDLRQLIDRQEVSEDCYVRPRGKVSWFPLTDLDEMLAEAENAAEHPVARDQTAHGHSKPLIVLALFLGVVGLLLMWDSTARLGKIERQITEIRTRQNAIDIRVEALRKGLAQSAEFQSSAETEIHDATAALKLLKTEVSEISKRPERQP